MRANEFIASMLERMVIEEAMKPGLKKDDQLYARYARDIGTIAARAIRAGGEDEVVACVMALERTLIFVTLLHFREGASAELLNNMKEQLETHAPISRVCRQMLGGR